MARNGRKGVNNDTRYKKIFDERGVEEIRQFRTPTIKETPDYITTFDYEWKYGDSFWSISNKFFRNVKYWYIIAQINNKPSESHIAVGETIKIPYDIYEALQVLR